jgi:hypothetical protein
MVLERTVSGSGRSLNVMRKVTSVGTATLLGNGTVATG